MATEQDEVLELEDEQQEQQQAPEQEDQHPDDEQHEDEQQGGEDREAIRAARREERRAKRDRAREREQTYIRQISSLSRQNQEMAGRLMQLERRQNGLDFARMDGAIQEAVQGTEYWKNQIALAAARGSEGAADLAEAQDRFYQSRKRADELLGLKQAYTQRSQAPQQVDPEVVGMAQKWATRNRWYDPNGGDQDSRVVLALDEQLSREGFDPRTPEYWEELDDRSAKYLPHRYQRKTPSRSGNSGYNNGADAGGRGSPVGGSDREVRGRTSEGGYHLSPERVAALKESGMWDDPDKRARMIKRYQEADKQLQRGE